MRVITESKGRKKKKRSPQAQPWSWSYITGVSGCGSGSRLKLLGFRGLGFWRFETGAGIVGNTILLQSLMDVTMVEHTLNPSSVYYGLCRRCEVIGLGSSPNKTQIKVSGERF